MDYKELDISFLPRRNQGDRGTCMACAVCSLLEYYFHDHGDDVRLSPQYLYAISKQKDEMPISGTGLKTAFDMAWTHGVCKEIDWPYNPCETPAGRTDDRVLAEMQIDEERLPELPTISCRDIPFHVFFTPTNKEECKAALRGDGGYRPMPVVIGCDVFISFTTDLHHDGWLHLPLPGEALDGGHAMLVVGYRDTPYSEYSKGYFIILNSWGKSFHDEEGHEGMLKIPYEYYDQYVTAAGTIRKKRLGNDDGHPNPQDAPTVSEMTVKKAPRPDNQQSPSSAMTNLSDALFASLETNLNSSSYKLPYDMFQIKPWIRHSAKPMPPQDVSKPFMGFVHENSKSDHALQATIKVFPLCKDSTFRLVAAALSHDDSSSVTSADIALLRDFIRRRLAKNGSHDVLVIAANVFDDDVQSLLSPPVILCTPYADGLWDYQLPKAVFSEESIQFLLHVLPGSPDAYADRLAALIDHWPKEIYCTKDALRPKLALHPSIPDAFFGHWLNVLFERAARSKDKNDWYAKDDRGVIYPPGGELPEGHGAKRVKRFIHNF